MAIGRKGNTSHLNLSKIGLDYDSTNGKIYPGSKIERESTNVPNVYALGDILKGVMELTPLAIKAGHSLVKRIHLRKIGKSEEAMKHQIEYSLVPTTIFTPLEYSCVGLTEEEAIEQFGKDNLEIFHSRFIPLEESLYKELDSKGELLRRKVYFKIICQKGNQKVLGAHYLGPNAGEIMQLMAVGMKMNITKPDLDKTIGIHPTIAEEFVLLNKDKLKGENPDKSSC